MTRYYSILRPVSIGTYPEAGAVKIENFESRQFCEEIGREAWGYIDYEQPLSKEQAERYDLMQGGIKTYFKAVTSVDMKGNARTMLAGTVEAYTKPNVEVINGKRRDHYIYYFDSREEALAHM